MRLWIRSPLACLDHPGSAGLVIEGNRIVEVLGKRQGAGGRGG